MMLHIKSLCADCQKLAVEAGAVVDGKVVVLPEHLSDALETFEPVWVSPDTLLTAIKIDPGPPPKLTFDTEYKGEYRVVEAGADDKVEVDAPVAYKVKGVELAALRAIVDDAEPHSETTTKYGEEYERTGNWVVGAKAMEHGKQVLSSLEARPGDAETDKLYGEEFNLPPGAIVHSVTMTGQGWRIVADLPLDGRDHHLIQPPAQPFTFEDAGVEVKYYPPADTSAVDQLMEDLRAEVDRLGAMLDGDYEIKDGKIVRRVKIKPLPDPCRCDKPAFDRPGYELRQQCSICEGLVFERVPPKDGDG